MKAAVSDRFFMTGGEQDGTHGHEPFIIAHLVGQCGMRPGTSRSEYSVRRIERYKMELRRNWAGVS